MGAGSTRPDEASSAMQLSHVTFRLRARCFVPRSRICQGFALYQGHSRAQMAGHPSTDGSKGVPGVPAASFDKGDVWGPNMPAAPRRPCPPWTDRCRRPQTREVSAGKQDPCGAFVQESSAAPALTDGAATGHYHHPYPWHSAWVLKANWLRTNGVNTN